MSEEITEKVNEQLTQRVNKAYIAKDYILLNGSEDNIIMIRGVAKNPQGEGSEIDTLLTFDVLEELVTTLKEKTLPKNKTSEEAPQADSETKPE